MKSCGEIAPLITSRSEHNAHVRRSWLEAILGPLGYEVLHFLLSMCVVFPCSWSPHSTPERMIHPMSSDKPTRPGGLQHELTSSVRVRRWYCGSARLNLWICILICDSHRKQPLQLCVQRFRSSEPLHLKIERGSTARR